MPYSTDHHAGSSVLSYQMHLLIALRSYPQVRGPIASHQHRYLFGPGAFVSVLSLDLCLEYFLTAHRFPCPRLYYGSGERKKLLMPSSDSLYSAFIRDAQPSAGSNAAASANLDQRYRTPAGPGTSHRHILSRSAQHISPEPNPQLTSDTVEVEVPPMVRLRSAIRKQTSSIWSPHLVRDRRASRYNIWEPPAAHWTPEAPRLGRQNIQRICFVAGFALPLSV